MRFLVIVSLLCTAAVGQSADTKMTQEVFDLCSIHKVAVVGDKNDPAVQATREAIENKTWMKKVRKPEQADAILEAEMIVTSFSMSLSGQKVTNSDRKGYVTMKLKQRQPEKLLWEGRADLPPIKTEPERTPDGRPIPSWMRPAEPSPVDTLLVDLQKKAGCIRR